MATSFLALLDEIFDTDGVALLWNVDGTKKYTTLEDIARAADHLEHFHSYKNIDSLHQKDDVLSIDMHADQGMFIAFIPALMIEDDEQGNARVVEGANAGDFLLQTRDGSVSVVDFGDGDGIVFMLGDGVDQYFNAKYDGPALRAAPHAMVMPEHSPNQARVWYGRMFLPPDEALNEIQGVSFGR